MQKLGLCLVSLGCIGFSQLWVPSAQGSSLYGVVASRPQPIAAAETTPSASESVQRLAQMFSTEIQETLNACWNQGKVDLAAGATRSGAVTCGNGTTDDTVTYADYVDTVSDILAASGLVGFRTVIASNPRVSPQMISTFVADPQGNAVLRQTVQTAIIESQLLPAEATQSNTILTDRVMERLLPSLQNPASLDGLLGSDEQYSQVVNNFCTSPGMSVDEAKAIVPDLSSIQLYAICIHESGVTAEALQMMQ